MNSRTAGTVILLSTVLFSCLLRAQNTPDPNSDEARVAEYCQALANGHEQAEVLKKACQYALTVQKALPNYICDEKVRRFDKANRLQDVIDAEVTVMNGRDTYSNIRVDGRHAEIRISQLPGIWSSGEFGMLMPLLFAAENKATFKFKKKVQLESRPALLFSFKVLESENRSFFIWNENGIQFTPGYSGSVWLDMETGRAIRVHMLSTRVKSTRTQYVSISTEYGEAPLKNGLTFLLPHRSSLNACNDNVFGSISSTAVNKLGGQLPCARNELEFTNCRKFRAEAKIAEVE